MAWAFCTEERLRGRMRNEIRFLGGRGEGVLLNGMQKIVIAS